MAQAGDIRVDTGEVRSTARQLTQLATDYDALYKEVLAKISETSAKWQGVDSEAFREQVEGFRDDFQKMKQEIDDYATFLLQSADAYEKQQEETRQKAKTLTN